MQKLLSLAKVGGEMDLIFDIQIFYTLIIFLSSAVFLMNLNGWIGFNSSTLKVFNFLFRFSIIYYLIFELTLRLPSAFGLISKEFYWG